MNITYDFMANANTVRNNQFQCNQTVEFLHWTIQNALNAGIDVSASTVKPATWQGVQETPFIGSVSGDQFTLSYTAGDGFGYPVGALNYGVSGPDSSYTASFQMTVNFFDVSHVTVALTVNPSIRARFDISNIDQNVMTTFVYGVLGSIPYIMDSVSADYYNGTSS